MGVQERVALEAAAAWSKWMHDWSVWKFKMYTSTRSIRKVDRRVARGMEADRRNHRHGTDTLVKALAERKEEERILGSSYCMTFLHKYCRGAIKTTSSMVVDGAGGINEKRRQHGVMKKANFFMHVCRACSNVNYLMIISCLHIYSAKGWRVVAAGRGTTSLSFLLLLLLLIRCAVFLLYCCSCVRRFWVPLVCWFIEAIVVSFHPFTTCIWTAWRATGASMWCEPYAVQASHDLNSFWWTKWEEKGQIDGCSGADVKWMVNCLRPWPGK